MPDDLISQLTALGIPADGASFSAPASVPPYQCLGHDRGKYYFNTARGGQVLELSAKDLSSPGTLLQLAPLIFWETQHPGKESFNSRAAADALIAACYAAGVYDPERVRGRGAWLDDGRVVLHLGDKMRMDGLPVEIASYSGRFIYERGGCMDVPDAEPLTAREASRLADLCQAVSWEDPEGMGRLLAGWLVVAPVCGALPWRPHLWLTSEAGGGKSWVLDNIIAPILRGFAVAVASKTTEPALRGLLGRDALPVLFEEAETQNEADRARMQQILDLARMASSEHSPDLVKAKSGGGGVNRYRIRSCFAFSSINVGLAQTADETRTVVVTIRPPADAQARMAAFQRLKQVHAEVMAPDFGARLLARTLSLLPAIRVNVETFALAIARHTGSRRTGDTLGVIMAGAYSLSSGRTVTAEEADKIVSGRKWVRDAAERAEVDPEWRKALSRLMQRTLRVPVDKGKFEDIPVGEVITVAICRATPDHPLMVRDASTALARAGIRIGLDGTEQALWLANTSTAIAEWMEDSPWAASWASTMASAPGAKRLGATKFGTNVSRALSVPLKEALPDG